MGAVEAHVVEVDGEQVLPLLDEPGAYTIPEQAYHADPLRHLGGSLSSTTARKLLAPSCPALARHAVEHPVHKDYFDLGTVTHRLILGAGCEVREVPAENWTTAGKAGREFREQARADGAVALLTKDLARAREMRDAVHKDPLAHALLTVAGAPERTLVWQEDVAGVPVWCRAMFDRWADPTGGAPVSADLKKTAKGLDDRSLSRTVWDLGYAQQEEWYRRGYRAVHGVETDFAFIFVQDTAPYLTRVFPLDEEYRAIARARNDEALRVWVECRESGVWPGYPSTFDPIGPPPWARWDGD